MKTFEEFENEATKWYNKGEWEIETSKDENKVELYKNITAPDLTRYYGLPAAYKVRRIEDKFIEKIIGKKILFTTSWDQKIEGVVRDTHFSIYGVYKENDPITRATIKVFLQNGDEHNVKLGSRIKVIEDDN